MAAIYFTLLFKALVMVGSGGWGGGGRGERENINISVRLPLCKSPIRPRRRHRCSSQLSPCILGKLPLLCAYGGERCCFNVTKKKKKQLKLAFIKKTSLWSYTSQSVDSSCWEHQGLGVTRVRTHNVWEGVRAIRSGRNPCAFIKTI